MITRSLLATSGLRSICCKPPSITGGLERSHQSSLPRSAIFQYHWTSPISSLAAKWQRTCHNTSLHGNIYHWLYSTPSRVLRSRDKLMLSKYIVTLSFAQQSFAINAHSTWNTLPFDCRSATCLAVLGTNSIHFYLWVDMHLSRS